MVQASRWLRIAAIGSAAIALGLVLGYAAPRLKASLSLPVPSVTLHADPACTPVGVGCSADGERLSIALYLGQSLAPLVAFPVEVDFDGLLAGGVSAVAVEFAMSGMEMGINRVVLQRQPGGGWRGRGLLPACSTGRMDWRARVSAETSDGRYAGDFALLLEP